ncbi:MAG TPA: GGDEF domain-containing protein, partial [Solirubrobacteraceae bacterium]|nr:GGDEF domain-containing protein [Solirubrobacteraceae bacterium]
RPELMFAASLAVCLSGFTTAILLAGREHRGDLAFLIWPAVTAYSRIPTRAAHAFTAMTAVLMTAAQLAVHPSVALARPMQVTVPVVALIAVAVFASAIRDSDARHRREAIVDELTGLLNRNALETRIDELRAQAQLSGERVGLLVIDIDHFKAINDAHGHAKGDEVMRELAMRLAGRLRAYDSLYRIGGEEFAVLLPGAGREELSELSEQLRESVASAPVAGLPVTISVGAARSWGGEELAWDELFLRADGALYCAKAAGRDRVRMAPD